MSFSKNISVLGGILLLFFSAVWGEDVCYDGLGCFSQDAPWVDKDRPFPPPEKPEDLGVSIKFFSRRQTKGEMVDVYPEIKFKGEGFTLNKRTSTITHGFQSSASSEWVLKMKDTILQHGDANIFLVNWEKGASNKPYFQAAANTRVVGAILGRFGRYLIEKRGLYDDLFHMIGHSLGAHITAYAANYIKNTSDSYTVARITGLDPAQPGFQNLSKEVRLSPDDATFVDVVHSDAKPFIPTSGFGYMYNLGTVDFYLNKGFDQPDCNDGEPLKNLTSIDQAGDVSTAVIANAVSCSHGRAYRVFTASIDKTVKCKFIGHRVKSYFPIITSDQSTCGERGKDCQRLGLGIANTRQRGGFQIMTSGKEPFCCYNYSPVTGCSATPGGGGTGVGNGTGVSNGTGTGIGAG